MKTRERLLPNVSKVESHNNILEKESEKAPDKVDCCYNI